VSPEQAERLVRIEEQLKGVVNLLEIRVGQVEDKLAEVQKGQHKLLIAVAVTVGAGTPIGAALLKAFA
jgi:pantothenate kinase